MIKTKLDLGVFLCRIRLPSCHLTQRPDNKDLGLFSHVLHSQDFRNSCVALGLLADSLTSFFFLILSILDGRPVLAFVTVVTYFLHVESTVHSTVSIQSTLKMDPKNAGAQKTATLVPNVHKKTATSSAHNIFTICRTASS